MLAVDDLRPLFGEAFGYPEVKTPNFDKNFLGEGLVFRAPLPSHSLLRTAPLSSPPRRGRQLLRAGRGVRAIEELDPDGPPPGLLPHQCGAELLVLVSAPLRPLTAAFLRAPWSLAC